VNVTGQIGLDEHLDPLQRCAADISAEGVGQWARAVRVCASLVGRAAPDTGHVGSQRDATNRVSGLVLVPASRLI
jgi:hypothetical protein